MTVLMLAGSARAEWIRLSTGAAFSDVTVFDYSQDGRHVVYREDVDADSAAEVFSVRLPASEPIRLSALIPVGSWADISTITPDGERVLFRSDQDADGVFQVYSVPIEGPAGAAVRLNGDLVAGGSVDYFRVSPDGTRVVYTAAQRFDGIVELFSVPVAGPSSSAVRISGSMVAGGDVSSSWLISPDSARVVYVADQLTDGVSELFSVPIAGPPASVVKLNAALVAGGEVLGPIRIAPDSSRVVYVANQENLEANELFSVPLAGPAASGIKLNPDLPGGGAIDDFQISPDAARVVYLANQEDPDRVEIYSAGLAGPAGVAVNLNPNLANGGQVDVFVISPDASRVVYRADQNAVSLHELFSVPILGPSNAGVRISGTMPASSDVYVNLFASSPDSSWVVYIADQEIDGWPTGHRTPLAGPTGNDELLWGEVLAMTSADFQIFGDGSQVLVRGSKAFSTGIERLWTYPLVGVPTPYDGTDWLAGQFQPDGDCDTSPAPRLLPGDVGALYVADQEIDEQFELYVVYFRLWGDDFEGGDTSRWSATVP